MFDVVVVQKCRPRQSRLRVFDKQAFEEVTKQWWELTRPADWIVHNHVNQSIKAVGKERRLSNVQFIQDTCQCPADSNHSSALTILIHCVPKKVPPLNMSKLL